MAKQVRFEDSEHIPNTDVFKESADLIDALAAEVEKLEALSQPVSMEPYCYEVVKAMCDTEFSRTKVKDAILNEPLYTATQMREYRNQALEEAAKVCEENFSFGALVIADAIRALKEQQK